MHRIRGRRAKRVRLVGKLPGHRTSRTRRALHAQPLRRIRQSQVPALRDRKGRANRPSATILRKQSTNNVERIA